jgi:hypothetical protein
MKQANPGRLGAVVVDLCVRTPISGGKWRKYFFSQESPTLNNLPLESPTSAKFSQGYHTKGWPVAQVKQRKRYALRGTNPIFYAARSGGRGLCRCLLRW